MDRTNIISLAELPLADLHYQKGNDKVKLRMDSSDPFKRAPLREISQSASPSVEDLKMVDNDDSQPS